MDELNIKNKCINCNEEFDSNKDLISLNYNKKTKREILKSLLNIRNYNNNSEKNIANDLSYFDNKKEINLLNHKIKRNEEK
jgi:hypothetical protein